MATGCFTVTLINEAESNARWMIRKVVPLVGIFYVSPILAVILYAAYKYYGKCRKIWRKRNPELQNLVIGNRFEQNLKYYDQAKILKSHMHNKHNNILLQHNNFMLINWSSYANQLYVWQLTLFTMSLGLGLGLIQCHTLCCIIIIKLLCIIVGKQ